MSTYYLKFKITVPDGSDITAGEIVDLIAESPSNAEDLARELNVVLIEYALYAEGQVVELVA